MKDFTNAGFHAINIQNNSLLEMTDYSGFVYTVVLS